MRTNLLKNVRAEGNFEYLEINVIDFIKFESKFWIQINIYLLKGNCNNVRWIGKSKEKKQKMLVILVIK